MMTRRITLTIAAAILGLILIGVLVFAATGGDETAATADTTVTTSTVTTTDEAEQGPEQASAIDGGQLYATNCASCHGDVGEGGSGGPVDDLSVTLDEVIDITANGVPRMPAFADTLAVEEIEAVSQHTLSLNKS